MNTDTTTDFLQRGPDFFSSREACSEFSKSVRRNKDESQKEYDARTQTNPRHSGFRQSIFHVGDPDQFQTYRYPKNSNEPCADSIPIYYNMFKDHPIDSWDGYKSVPATACKNTFDYIFNKFKKGIFVKILNGKLKVFLPFSKSKFRNEYGHLLKVDPKYKNLDGFLAYIQNLDNKERKKTDINARSYNYDSKYVHQDTSNWYANNCLFRYEAPITESDTNVLNLKNMLVELCEEREVPDIEFFMNRRDFPLLTRDGTEAYDAIYGGATHPLVSHSYDKYLPILSMSKTDRFADVLVPTHEDWARVQSLDEKWIPPCKSYEDNFSTPWVDRKPTAVFRGKSTGCGVSIDTNQRLRLAYISSITPPDPDGVAYIDAGITSWALRPRKSPDSPYLQTIDPEALPFELVTFMSPEEQATYKYIINVDGHVSAFRLSYELSMGSTLLIIESQWKIWCSSMLKPYVHYVPIKEDMSDLISQIKWCRDHDSECETISKNAREFYDTYLQRDGILDFMQKILVDLKNEVGTYLYNDKTPLDTQINIEYADVMRRWYPSTDKGVSDINVIPFGGRTYGRLQGIQWIVNMINTLSKFQDVVETGPLIFSNKLGTVHKYSIAGTIFAVKSTTDPAKYLEHIHEAYVCLKEINKLVKKIPNFVYVYGAYRGDNKSYNVVTEYISGMMFSDYINSKQFNFEDFLFILLQLCLALEIAQSSCGFVHWDLMPWNIIIQASDSLIEFDYLISYDKIYRLQTRLIPVIIDFGKSHVIHKQHHHGFIDMYRSSTIQDVMMLLSGSLVAVLERRDKLVSRDLTSLFRLAEFLIPPGHGLNTNGLKERLKNMSRYQNSILDSKGRLEKLGPMDLFNAIRNLNYRFKINTAPSYNSVMAKDNARQVFDYTLASTVDDQFQSYLDVFGRLNKCDLPQPTNLFSVYYTTQTFYSNITSVYSSMESFLSRNKTSLTLDENIHKMLLTAALEYIQDSYGEILRVGEVKQISYKKFGSDFTTLIPAPYDSETFLLPDVVYNLLTSTSNDVSSMNALNKYKEMIDQVLSNGDLYKLSDTHRSQYIEMFKPLLEVSGMNMINNCAMRPTLLTMAKLIYEKDRESLENSYAGGCKKLDEYMEMYDKILDLFNLDNE